MTVTRETQEGRVQSADAVHAGLRESGFGPYLATPCGVLAPLLTLLQETDDYHVVPREDNGVAIAAGMSLAGRFPVVLMQNSGFGQSVNALASLVVPYRIPMLLVISMRGTGPDPTAENLAMGRLTPSILNELGVQHQYLDVPRVTRQLDRARSALTRERGCFALLVRPDAFDWRA